MTCHRRANPLAISTHHNAVTLALSRQTMVDCCPNKIKEKWQLVAEVKMEQRKRKEEYDGEGHK